MSWIQTIEGNELNLAIPSSEAISPDTLCRILARTPRFGGHWKNGIEWYSVAQHSLLVSSLLPSDLQLAGLLHDAHEAFWGFGDVLRPAKHLQRDVADFFRLHAMKHDTVIARRFGVNVKLFHHEQVKQADNIMLATEKRDLMAPAPRPWEELPEASPVISIEPTGIDEAYRQFSARLHELLEVRIDYVNAYRGCKEEYPWFVTRGGSVVAKLASEHLAQLEASKYPTWETEVCLS